MGPSGMRGIYMERSWFEQSYRELVLYVGPLPKVFKSNTVRSAEFMGNTAEMSQEHDPDLYDPQVSRRVIFPGLLGRRMMERIENIAFDEKYTPQSFIPKHKTMSARIRHLPSTTQAKLRSTQILTSLPQVVSELVQNSLDAGAKRIELGVDCEEWSCWVRDDGCGMSKSELTSLIDTGRYSTSKAYTPASLEEVNTFGFRGEECLYNGPAIRWRLENPGTVVSVRDAFYNALDEYMELSQPLSATRRSPKKSEKKPVYVLDITVPPEQVDNCLEPAKAVVHLQDSSGEKGEFIWTDARTGETFAVDRRTGNSYSINERQEDAAGIGGGRRTLAPRPQSSDGKRLGVAVGARLSGREGQEKREEAPKWIQEALGANGTYMLMSSQRSIPALSLSSSGAQEIDEWHRQNGYARPSHSYAKARAVARAAGRKQLPNTRSHVAQFTKTDLEHAEVLAQVDRKFVACVLRTSAATEDSQWAGENQPCTRGDDHAQPTLVLIDQHAADERIRVERILRELCSAFIPPGECDSQSSSVPVRFLVPPVCVLLTRHEAEQLARLSGVRHAFELWGIRFTDDSLDFVGNVHNDDRHSERKRLRDDSGFAQVSVDSVPEILAAKLLEDDTLRDLIKSYLAELAASGNAEAVSTGVTHAHNADVDSTKSAATKGWQRALRWCPRELLELANSKACRGAIMFNDVLLVDRCVRLVRELAGAALPFQCAHGRPSLVPLASLGAEANKNTAGKAKSVAYSRHLQPVDWSQFAREASVSNGIIDERE
ncbi:hypothetical protein EIP86_003954 [Pleurotus ostreatoroseus]|nr:hypothetical protein EIP86_003954 [Pleurotus ostreatoroseus]